jgi:hypothetical protein
VSALTFRPRAVLKKPGSPDAPSIRATPPAATDGVRRETTAIPAIPATPEASAQCRTAGIAEIAATPPETAHSEPASGLAARLLETEQRDRAAFLHRSVVAAYDALTARDPDPIEVGERESVQAEALGAFGRPVPDAQHQREVTAWLELAAKHPLLAGDG